MADKQQNLTFFYDGKATARSLGPSIAQSETSFRLHTSLIFSSASLDRHGTMSLSGFWLRQQQPFDHLPQRPTPQVLSVKGKVLSLAALAITIAATMLFKEGTPLSSLHRSRAKAKAGEMSFSSGSYSLEGYPC